MDAKTALAKIRDHRCPGEDDSTAKPAARFPGQFPWKPPRCRYGRCSFGGLLPPKFVQFVRVDLGGGMGPAATWLESEPKEFEGGIQVQYMGFFCVESEPDPLGLRVEILPGGFCLLGLSEEQEKVIRVANEASLSPVALNDFVEAVEKEIAEKGGKRSSGGKAAASSRSVGTNPEHQ